MSMKSIELLKAEKMAWEQIHSMTSDLWEPARDGAKCKRLTEDGEKIRQWLAKKFLFEMRES